MAQVHEDNVGTITNSHYWIIKARADRRSLESALLSELKKIDRDAATSNIRTMNEFLSESIAPRRFSLRLLTVFSGAALLLAVMGILWDDLLQRQAAHTGDRCPTCFGRATVAGIQINSGPWSENHHRRISSRSRGCVRLDATNPRLALQRHAKRSANIRISLSNLILHRNARGSPPSPTRHPRRPPDRIAK